MELVDQVPGGLVTIGALGVILAVVLFGFITKAVKLAVIGLALFFALGGWAYVEGMSDRAEAALEHAREAAEEAAEQVEEKVDRMK
jgi:hypothetical protein